MELRRDHMFNPLSPPPEFLAWQASAPELTPEELNRKFNDPANLVPKGVPPPAQPTPSEVRSKAAAMTSSIFNNYYTLQKIIQRHEATIQKRWIKKTRPQKLKMLLSVWPDMPSAHRPDFLAFRTESNSSRHAGTKFRNSYLWPYINQEDLTKPRTLLLLINSRGRHPPCDFAATDGDSMYLGKVSSAIVPPYLNCYVFILNGATQPETYGKLFAFEDRPDAFDLMISRRQFLPGEGLFILEAQQRLMEFLVQCCYQILHDIPSDTITSDTFPLLPEPHVKTDAEVEGYESILTMAAEAQYRVPETLDFGYIYSLLDARASAAEDHLWALREDPSYFANYLQEVKEHRLEMLLDTDGRPHPSLSPARENVFWARILGVVVSQAYIQLELFSKLRHQAQGLQSLQDKYKAKISQHTDLPEDYLKAILMFQHYLNQAAKGPLNRLKNTIASPPMRRIFERVPDANSMTDKIVGVSKTVKLSAPEERLIWLLSTLWEDGRTLFLARQTTIIDQLQRLVDSDRVAKDMVTAHVAAIIGDLSIIGQSLRQLELYQPWANRFVGQSFEYLEEFKEAYATDNAKWAALVSGFEGNKLIGNPVVDKSKPGGSRFNYPVGKRRTQQNVESMREAEATLDAFWEGIDQIMQRKQDSVKGSAVSKLLAQGRALQRTPEWTAPTVDKTAPGATKKAPQNDIDLLTRPFSSLYFGSSEPSGPVLPVQLPRTKAKTRGTPRTTAEQVGEIADGAQLGQDALNAQPTIGVDARALKVFRTLFFNPEVTSTPGEVPWPDFLHAMASTGFTAQKLYGSVWQFRPTRVDVERAIQFHEPHPHGKIPFVTARRHGRRLNRAYGWSGVMFVLKQ